MVDSYEFDVFISYAHEDRDTVEKIATHLRTEGVRVWMDKSGIHAGAEIKEEIIAALSKCRRVVVICSAHLSDWVLFETAAFVQRKENGAVIPVRLDKSPMPSVLQGIRYIKWENDPGNVQELVNACRASVPIVLLGGVYLDVGVQPVHTTILRGDEHTTLGPLTLELGGSAVVVGRYLFEHYSRRSTLITMMSSDPLNLFAVNARDLLDREKWIQQHNAIQYVEGQPATTVLLHQASGSFSTMLTHKGVLAALSWDRIGDRLNHAPGGPRILYISGYFKTGLEVRLCENLSRLGNTVVVLDHGRLMPKEQLDHMVAPLMQAFEEKQIDVYVCTSRELWDLLSRSTGSVWESSDDILPSLQAIAKREILPHITYVRNRRFDPRLKSESYEAYCIVGREVHQLHEKPEVESGFIVKSNSFVKNIFNAALLNALPAPSPKVSRSKMDALHIQAGRIALRQSQAPTIEKQQRSV